MDEASSLAESLEALIVQAVEPTSDKANSALYGDAIVVRVSGVQCVAKALDTAIIFREQLSQEEKAPALKSYSESCVRTRELQHPNLVHFMGVYAAGPEAPLLVTELLPMSLAFFIGEYPRIPTHLKCSILLDVALGLRYLHDQSPPIVHGRASADCVMLSDTLTAKLTGHLALSCYAARQSEYTPPEVTSKNEPPTDAQSDVFAFGNLLMYITLQRKPSLLLSKKQRPHNDSEVVSLTEVQRREVFLREMGEGTWSYELTTKCLNDAPASRPNMIEIISTLEQICKENPPPYTSFFELISALDQLIEAKETITSLNTIIDAKQEEIGACRDEQQAVAQGLEAKDLELEATRLELKTQKQVLEGKDKLLHAHNQAMRAKDALIKAKDRELAAKKKEIDTKATMLRAANKRAKILEQHLIQKRTAMVSPLPPSPPNGERFLKPIPEPPTATMTSSDAESIVVKRSVRGRRSSKPIASDGLMYQDWQEQVDASRRVDPKLASIFARRQKHIEESLADAERKKAMKKSTSDSQLPPEPPAHQRSLSMEGPSPELH